MTQPSNDRERLRAALGESQRDRFAPGFADRAAARWRAEVAAGAGTTISFDAAVTRLFSRLAPFAVAAALLLAVNNVRHRSEGQSIARALVGAPAASTAPSSLDTIYGLGTLVLPNQE